MKKIKNKMNTAFLLTIQNTLYICPKKATLSWQCYLEKPQDPEKKGQKMNPSTYSSAEFPEPFMNISMFQKMLTN